MSAQLRARPESSQGLATVRVVGVYALRREGKPVRAEGWERADLMIDLRLGDCLKILPTLDAGSIDAVVTDPPYGLGFMGKRWDVSLPSLRVWAECYRVMK